MGPSIIAAAAGGQVIERVSMSDRATALGALLITISDMCDAAEAHGIVENPPAAAMAPLIEQAARLGIVFDAPPALQELQLAIESAAQRASTDGS